MAETYEKSMILLGSGDKETGSGGSTIKELLDASALGLLGVGCRAVVCNNSPRIVPGFYEKVEEHNKKFGADVKVITVNSVRYPAADGEKVKDGAQTLAEAQACVDIMDEYGADFFGQAGFMKQTVGALMKKIGINTHPGPLENPDGVPGVDTKGLHGIEVQEAVLERGYPYSAHTTHGVTADYDSGEIFAWRPVFVRPGDTPDVLFERVQIVEKACLPFDIKSFAQIL
jgi:folate-dependent phosphoribosylglycinamide formyltransferase PurN